jgi:hypothetical protein
MAAVAAMGTEEKRVAAERRRWQQRRGRRRRRWRRRYTKGLDSVAEEAGEADSLLAGGHLDDPKDERNKIYTSKTKMSPALRWWSQVESAFEQLFFALDFIFYMIVLKLNKII